MQRRVLFQMVLAILLAAGVAGCTDAPTDGGSAGDDGDAGAPGDEQPGPLFGFDPGIEVVPLPAGEPGVVEGHVYDVTNGTAVQQATVTATCIRQALPGAESTETRDLPVGGDGSFVMTATGAFADCLTVTYTIEAPGYTIEVPLEAGPLVPGIQYLIYGGMTPQP